MFSCRSQKNVKLTPHIISSSDVIKSKNTFKRISRSIYTQMHFTDTLNWNLYIKLMKAAGKCFTHTWTAKILTTFAVYYLGLRTTKRVIGKQCRPRSDAADCGVWSGSPLFANSSAIFLQEYLNIPKIESGLFQYIMWRSLSSLQWINPLYSGDP